jgi:uncharacterized protein (TIGR03437 family)
LVAIFGTRLASGSVQATGLPLPTALSSTSVSINQPAGCIPTPTCRQQTASLYYVSENQINAVLPPNLASGGTATVVVTSGGTASPPFPISITAAAPAIFSISANGTGQAILFNASYQLVSTVSSGDTVSFYATGLTPTTAATNRFAAYIGDAATTVTYAGPASYPGIYQINITVPDLLLTDRLYITSTSTSLPPTVYRSNFVNVGVRPRRNVTDSFGSIEPLYPQSSSQITISPLPTVGRFTAQFTIRPGAGLIPIAAISDGGSTVLLFDPAKREFSGTVTAPTGVASAWDFSQALPGFLVTDFLTGGTPFPGNIIPRSRIEPSSAAALLMLPNAFSLPGVTGCSFAPPNMTCRIAENVGGGSTVVIDSRNHAPLSYVGGFTNLPYAPFRNSRSTTFALYIDGQRVASEEVSFALPPKPTYSVTPASGTGLAQVFTLQISDPSGLNDPTNILSADFAVDTPPLKTCRVQFRPPNLFYLANDVFTGPFLGPITAGSGTLANSQCKVDGAASTASISDGRLNLQIALTFSPSFSGTKTLWLDVSNIGTSVRQNVGSWTVR